MNGNSFSPSLQDLANQMAMWFDPRFRSQLPSLNPYAGLSLNDPMFDYTFGLQQGAPPPPPEEPERANPEHGMYVEFAGIPANLDPNLTGTLEQREPMSEYDAFMSWLANRGHQPPRDRAPGMAARHPIRPGSLEQQAGLEDLWTQADQAYAARRQAQQRQQQPQQQQQQPPPQQQQQPQQQQPPWSPQQQPLSWPPSQEAPKPWQPQ
jgi:hypothetical protein